MSNEDQRANEIVIAFERGPAPDLSVPEARAAVRMALYHAGSHRVSRGNEVVGAFRLGSGREIEFATEIARTDDSIGIAFSVASVDPWEAVEAAIIHDRICNLLPQTMRAVAHARAQEVA